MTDKPDRKTLAEQIARARQKVLSNDLKEFNATLPSRVWADAEARREVKEMRSRLLPQIEAIRDAMLTGTLDLNKDWVDAAEKFFDRAEGKATQLIGSDPEHPFMAPLITVYSADTKAEVEHIIDASGK